MQLSEYLKSRHIRLQEFADLVGISMPSISKLARGVNRPSLETMSRIYEASGGEVTPEDFRQQYVNRL